MAKRKPRGNALYHPVMVRLAADQLRQLDYCCQRWGQARGTAARNLIVDGLSELLHANSPLRAGYLGYVGQANHQADIDRRLKPTAKQARLAAGEPLPPPAAMTNLALIRPKGPEEA